MDDITTELSKMQSMFEGKESRDDKIAREKKEQEQSNKNRNNQRNNGGGKGQQRNNNGGGGGRNNGMQQYQQQRNGNNQNNNNGQRYQPYQNNNNGNYQQQQQQGAALATRGCVPHFNPDDTCKRGKDCPFRHTGNQPPDHAIHTYYNKQGGAPQQGGAGNGMPFAPLMGPAQWQQMQQKKS